MCAGSPNLMLQSQFSVEGLYSLRDPFKTGLVPATDSRCWLNQMPRTGSRSTMTGTPPPTADEGDIENNGTTSVDIGGITHGSGKRHWRTRDSRRRRVHIPSKAG